MSDLEGFTPEQVVQYGGSLPALEPPPAGEEGFTPEQVLGPNYADGIIKNPTTQANMQHPDISAYDRLWIKGVQRSPEETASWLRNAGFSAEIDKDGEVSVWKPGDKYRYRVDPTGFDVQDVSDFAPEGAIFGMQSLIPGIAKVGGAVAAPVTGGTSLAGAAALGGAWSAGTETALQSLGVLSGYKEGYTPGDIGLAGAAGALVPGVGSLLNKPGTKAFIGKAGDAAKSAMLTAANIAYDLPWSKLLGTGPKNLSVAISQASKDFMLSKESGEIMKVLPRVIDRVMNLAKSPEVKLLDKPLFSGVIPKNNEELFSLALHEKEVLGKRLGDFYAAWDSEIAPEFFGKKVEGLAGELRPNKFTFGDMRTRIDAMIGAAKNSSAGVYESAVATAKEIEADFSLNGYRSLNDLWNLKQSHDNLVVYAKDLAGETKNSVERRVADFYRSFIDDTVKIGAEQGDLLARVSAKMSSSGDTLSRLFSGNKKDIKGRLVDLPYVNEIYGDLVEVTRLANAAQASATAAGGEFFKAMSGTFGGPFNPAAYMKLANSPWGRYLKERVANRTMSMAEAASSIARGAAEDFEGAIPRSLVAIRNMPGAFTKRLMENPTIAGMVQSTGTGTGLEGLIKVVLDGPEEAAAQVLSKVVAEAPEMFTPARTGRLSEMDGKLIDNTDRLAESMVLKNRRELSRTERAQMRSGLHLDGTLSNPTGKGRKSTKVTFAKSPDLSEPK